MNRKLIDKVWTVIVKLRQGSGKDGQGMVFKASEDAPEDSDNVRAAGGADSSPVLLASRRNWN